MSDAEKILGAIAGIADRLEALEKQSVRVEDRCLVTERSIDRIERKFEISIDRIERKLNGVARKLLSQPECAGLGIADPRTPTGASTVAMPAAMAAKGNEE